MTKTTLMVTYECTLALTARDRSISGNSSGVERCLAKAKVAGSNPVSRSKNYHSSFLSTHMGLLS